MLYKKYLYCLLFIFLFVFIYNINAYTITDSNTTIILKDKDLCQISTILNIEDINSENLTLPFLPVYDVLVYVNNNEVDISYTNIELFIDLYNIDYNVLNLKIIYLTDYFITKDHNSWHLIYRNPFSLEHISENILFETSIDNFNLENNINSGNISLKEDYLNITFFNKSYIELNYNIEKENTVKNKNLLLYYISIVLIFILLIFFLVFRFKIKDKSKNNLLKGLNKNEQKIIKLLLEKKQITQKKIALETDLTKASISRNLKKLENKNYIKIIPYGRTNKIELGDIFKK